MRSLEKGNSIEGQSENTLMKKKNLKIISLNKKRRDNCEKGEFRKGKTERGQF